MDTTSNNFKEVTEPPTAKYVRNTKYEGKLTLKYSQYFLISGAICLIYSVVLKHI